MTDTSKIKPPGQAERIYCRQDTYDWLLPSPTNLALVEILTRLAGSGQIRCDLVWPGVPEHPAILHALANLDLCAAGNFKGFRTLVYPVLPQGLSDLQRFRIDRQVLHARGQALWEKGTHLSEVVLLMFDPSTVRDDLGKPRFHPTLRNLFPVFQVVSDDAIWPETDLGFMHETIQAVARNRRASVKKRAAKQCRWSDSPMAVLAIGGRLARQQREQRINEAFGPSVRAPDLIILDGRYKVLQALEIPVDHLLHVVNILARLLTGRRPLPGLWVLFDQPDDSLAFRVAVRRRLKALSDDTDLERRWLHQLLDDFAVRLQPGGWLSPNVDPPWPCAPVEWPSPYKIDRETAKLARAVTALIHHSDCTPPLEDALWPIYLWLTRVSNLTIPLKTMQDWLVDNPEKDFARRRWDLLEVLSPLQRLIDGGLAGTLHSELAGLIKAMKQIFSTWLAQGQPMSHAFTQAIDRITLQQDGPVHVVVQTVQEQDLLREKYADCGVSFHRTAEMHLMDIDQSGQPLLLTALDRHLLTRLLLNAYSPKLEWLLTPRTLCWMQRYLAGLCEGTGLGPIAPRIQELRKVVEASLAQPGMELFTLPPPANRQDMVEPSSTEGTGSPSRNTMMVRLDDGSTCKLWSTQTVYRIRGPGTTFNLEPVCGEDLQKGDVVFLPDSSLDKPLEQALSEEALQRMMVSHKYTTHVQAYHAVLRECYARHPAPADRRIETIARQMEATLGAVVSLVNLRNWLKPVLHPELIQGRAYAPEHYFEFECFALAVGLHELLVPNFWSNIIRYRGERRATGRKRHAVLLQCLLHPESAAAYCGSDAQALSALRDSARRHLYTITAIISKEAACA